MQCNSTISTINHRETESWSGKIFITLDIDWAHDDIINAAIDIIEEANVSATWFITHNTPVLNRLRSNSQFELGIHPNFNFLLNGQNNAGNNARDVVQRCMDIVPEAKTVRSHSLTQSSNLLDIFKECGLTHEANHYIPNHSDIDLCPWKEWNGLLRVPHTWEDDLHLMYEAMGMKTINPLEIALTRSEESLLVYDFHPIHLFLNTENIDRYENTRIFHQSPRELIEHVCNGDGIRVHLVELLSAFK